MTGRRSGDGHPRELTGGSAARAVRSFWLDLGWLVTLVVTVAVPLGLDAVGALTYMTSLLFWLTPIVYLSWTFMTITAGGQGRRRKALLISTLTIVGLGLVLDFLLGFKTLRFPDCARPDWGQYVRCLPAVGGMIPVEEVLFYALGPVAMVLVYACADEQWLRLYNPPDDLLDVRLLQVSWPLVYTAGGAGLVLVAAWRLNGTFPTYAAFLSAGALLPAVFLYRCMAGLTNWPAFAVTTLYVSITSVIWEATLAIPRGWWGYEPTGMLGWTVKAWGRDAAIFPVEAAFVWLAAPFVTVLLYEFAKALMHAPDKRSALFGP
jgi:hypothetical protein